MERKVRTLVAGAGVLEAGAELASGAALGADPGGVLAQPMLRYLVHQHHTYPESPLVLCVTGFVTSVTRMSRRLIMIVEDV